MNRAQTVYTEVSNLYQTATTSMGSWMWHNHTQWVADKAQNLAKKYNANTEYAYCAALLHDLGDSKYERGDANFDSWSWQTSKLILKKAGFRKSQRDAILEAIRTHSCHPGEDWSELRTDWRSVPFDRNNPPAIVECADNSARITQASIIEVSGKPFVRKAYPNQQQGVLVHIDTGNTERCADGGFWTVRSGNPREFMRGKQGQHRYTVRPRGGSFGFADPCDEPREHVDETPAWDIGLLLLMPGDSLEVSFKAPGELVGLLSCCLPGRLDFEWVSQQIDPSSGEWEPPDYQEEQDLDDDMRALDRGRDDNLFEDSY